MVTELYIYISIINIIKESLIEQSSSDNHFLCSVALCSLHCWSGVIVAIHHFPPAWVWTTFITSHLPELSWAAKSQSLSGKQKITVIERQGKQMSNWYWPGMTHRPFAFPCHFKLVSDLQNRNPTPLLLSCHSLMVNADGWAVSYWGLQKALRSLKCDQRLQSCDAVSSDHKGPDEFVTLKAVGIGNVTRYHCNVCLFKENDKKNQFTDSTVLMQY